MMVSLVQPDKPYQLFLSQGLLFGFGLACMQVISYPVSALS